MNSLYNSCVIFLQVDLQRRAFFQAVIHDSFDEVKDFILNGMDVNIKRLQLKLSQFFGFQDPPLDM